MYKLILKPSFQVDDILGLFGDKVVFASESEGIAEVVVEGEGPWNFPFVERVEPYASPPIDWETQWGLHSPGFKQGVLELLVGGQTLKMKAGPGFGNLSHPTTRLMLELMPPYIPGKIVLDIGTGSGILALAAAVLKAKRVIALDIDPEAVKHAQENAALNDLEIDFDLAQHIPEVTLLNMILTEQKNALSALRAPRGLLLTSGVLADQEREALDFALEKGWKLQKLVEKEGWLAFLFKV